VLQTAAPGVVLLEAIGSHVSIVRRAGSSHRRLMFYGSDGRVRHMSLLSSNSWSQQVIEERNMQLLRCFNRLLDAQPQSRARALAWYVPIHTPLAHFMRLVEEDPSFASYGEAYEVSCTRYGREADLPILHLKRRCSQVSCLYSCCEGPL
jgi:transformation/transcription domain-associated protein